MKLLFVLPEFPPDFGGGVATFYGALLPELVRAGHSVHVLVGSAFVQASRRYTYKGVSVELLEPERFARHVPTFNRYAALPELARHLVAARALWEQADGGTEYDAVEVVDWGLLFAPWVTEQGPPVIVQLHGSSGQIAAYDAYAGMELMNQVVQLLEVTLLPYATVLHTHSTSNAAFWQEQTGRPVTVSPPPLAAVSQEPNKGEHSGKGFVAARLQRWKGPEVLAEALRQMGGSAPVVEWAGRSVLHPESGRPYEVEMAARFSDVWGHRLRWLQRLEPTAVAERQASSAFVVAPSLWDVYNLTVVEAMQRCAVVICSSGAGAVDLVVHGENGFVVPPGDSEALAVSMAQVLALSRSKRRAIGEAARETVIQALQPERIAHEALKRYEGLNRLAYREIPSWVRSAIAPGSKTDIGSFLGHLPTSGLVRHLAKRLVSKIYSR